MTNNQYPNLPTTFTPVNLLTPPATILEPALGYVLPPPYDLARWVAFYWERCGDEAAYADGRHSMVGINWRAYLSWVDHPTNARRLSFPCPSCEGTGAGPSDGKRQSRPCSRCWGVGLVSRELGDSETQAKEWLILNRETRQTYVAPVGDAGAFLCSQWEAPAAGELPGDPAVVFEVIKWGLEQIEAERAVDPRAFQAEVERQMKREQELTDRLVDWLSQCSNEL